MLITLTQTAGAQCSYAIHCVLRDDDDEILMHAGRQRPKAKGEGRAWVTKKKKRFGEDTRVTSHIKHSLTRVLKF